MKVLTKSGVLEEVDFNKIVNRLQDLCNIQGLRKLDLDVTQIAQHAIKMMVDGISTMELDDISSNYCAASMSKNLDFGELASRIEMDNIHRQTLEDYVCAVDDMRSYSHQGRSVDILNPLLVKAVHLHGERLQREIDYSRDYHYDYFGIKTLKKSYLISHRNDSGAVVKERPQHMCMRVAIGIHLNLLGENGWSEDVLENVVTTYKALSLKKYTHATPTLFNAGTCRQALSSCFLLSVDDSIEDIYGTLAKTAYISKWSGGIGVHVSQVRAKNAIIASTNGHTEGIVPMLGMFNKSALYISQGGNKRKGSIAVYIEMWHADIEDFLDLKKPLGDENLRARDLFLALWVCDLFMERLSESIHTNKPIKWSLFCPSRAPGLADVYGDEYKKLYLSYESDKLYSRQVDIQELWDRVMTVQMESGVPYVSFKDHVNRKNNQNNLGTIKSSNLCVSGDTRIMVRDEYNKRICMPEISTCVGREVHVWNGREWSPTIIVQTSADPKPMMLIKFSNGCHLKCTPYHRFYISKESVSVVNAWGLQIGDRLEHWDIPYPRIPSDNQCNSIYYLAGMYYAGKFPSGKVFVSHNASSIKRLTKDIPWVKTPDGHVCEVDYSDNNIHGTMREILDKGDVSKRISFVAGVVDVCGHMNESSLRIILSHVDESTRPSAVHHLSLILTTLGIFPRATKNGDGLTLSMWDTHELFVVLGMRTAIIKPISYELTRSHRAVTVTGVEFCNPEPTYCFKESKRSRGMFSGVVAGNCNEINIYTDRDNIGVCNLASLCLSKFVKNGKFNFKELHSIAKLAVRNLNNVIDNNVYPVQEGEYSDRVNRPIGLGVQSLAKTFMKLGMPFTSEPARTLNRQVFETIYHAAIEASCELAKMHGPYENYGTSMMASGKMQFDLWGVTPSDLWDWNALRLKVKDHGVRNSLLIALMPTASTAQIMGNTESFEPITSNIYARATLSGTFQCVNKYLIKDLQRLGLWSESMRASIIHDGGSVQNIASIPSNIKQIYQTVWEIKQKDLIDMEADRNAYVCQSTSSNRYLQKPTFGKLKAMHLYAWKKGLKTGMYYLRSKAAAEAVKFTLDKKEECLECSA